MLWEEAERAETGWGVDTRTGVWLLQGSLRDRTRVNAVQRMRSCYTERASRARATFIANLGARASTVYSAVVPAASRPVAHRPFVLAPRRALVRSFSSAARILRSSSSCRPDSPRVPPPPQPAPRRGGGGVLALVPFHAEHRIPAVSSPSPSLVVYPGGRSSRDSDSDANASSCDLRRNRRGKPPPSRLPIRDVLGSRDVGTEPALDERYDIILEVCRLVVVRVFVSSRWNFAEVVSLTRLPYSDLVVDA